MPYSLLVIDDEPLTLRTVDRALSAEGFEVLQARTGEEGLRLYHQHRPDLLLVDIVLPGIDGLEVLRQVKHENPSAMVLMMSAYQVVERAVEAMKLGAFDYLTKPYQLDDLVATIRRATELLSLRVRVNDTVESAKDRYDFGKVTSRNPALCRALEVARKTAETDSTILILGETGTGKEVAAKAIHYASPRAQMPMLSLNCAALPDALLESELFGFEPGAFTDARRRKLGLLERAHGGTLFLDEIGNMSHPVQAKLLRVLEEGSFMRLGGSRPIHVDVRIIAATNRDLKQAVAQGHFRQDLFYRLNVVPLSLPPLRERREDILPLALEMVQRFNRDLKKRFTGFTPAAAELLTSYSWPGNIRELRNVIERTMILAPEGYIDAVSLPEEIREHLPEPEPDAAWSGFEVSPTGHQFPTLRELEDHYIQEVLHATGGNKTAAARVLGIHPTSLLRRLKQMSPLQNAVLLRSDNGETQ